MRRVLALAAFVGVLTGAAFAQEMSAAPPPAAPVPAGPQIVFSTSMGDFTVELDTVGAPKTAANFQRAVRAGHYNNARFYRIEPGFLIQLGDQDAKGAYRKPPVPTVPLETATTKHSKYALGLAHGEDPNSGQTTWYIDLAENAGLNAQEGAPPNTTGFTAFGKVISGFEVVDAISQVERAPTGGPFPGKLPATPVIVKTAKIVPAAAP